MILKWPNKANGGGPVQPHTIPTYIKKTEEASMFSKFRLPVGIAAVMALAISIGACGNADSANGDATQGGAAQTELLPKDDALAGAVPAPIRQRGTLIFATDATSPPNESVAEDGHTLVGNEIDFGNQIASVLGLKAEFININFDSIIAGLQAGRYDTAISGMFDTKKRETAVDFVTYAQTGSQLFARSADKDKVTTLDGLCGHSFAVMAGSVQEKIGYDQNDKCIAAGKPPVDVHVFKNQTDQVQAVASGQVEVGSLNGPNIAYLEKQSNGSMVAIGDTFFNSPWAMPVPKDSGLLEPMHSATVILLKSPQYQEILKKWGVETQAISESVINGANN